MTEKRYVIKGRATGIIEPHIELNAENCKDALKQAEQLLKKVTNFTVDSWEKLNVEVIK